jgi:hypothetical protein
MTLVGTLSSFRGLIASPTPTFGQATKSLRQSAKLVFIQQKSRPPVSAMAGVPWQHKANPRVARRKLRVHHLTCYAFRNVPANFPATEGFRFTFATRRRYGSASTISTSMITETEATSSGIETARIGADFDPPPSHFLKHTPQILGTDSYLCLFSQMLLQFLQR